MNEKINKEMEEQLEESSEHIKSAVCHANSIMIDCEFCGRTHFCSDKPKLFKDENELDWLLKNAEKYPDKFFDHGITLPSWGYIEGKQVVVDCPCKVLRKYEDFFWSHRHIIMEYFQNMEKS